MDLDVSYPSLADLARRARRRVPYFVWEYLDSATGNEAAMHRNSAALDRITLTPRAFRRVEPDISAKLLGRDYPMPVGVAPVGMSGLVWPGAEMTLAAVCAEAGLPYCLSTVAAATPEQVGPYVGNQGWFQLYAPGAPEIRRDMLARARDAGFHTLVLTVDLQAPSRRERQRRARLTNPMRVGPHIVAQAALRPAWAVATVLNGTPKLATLEKYADIGTARGATAHAGYLLRTAPDLDYLRALRKEWSGSLVVKGVLHPDDAVTAAGIADAVWVSNHGGRQFEASHAAIDVLPEIRDAVGKDFPLICDGGIRSGTDVLRMLARGADFVMLGRAFHHGLAAFGAEGARHVLHILRDGIMADMGQLGASNLSRIIDSPDTGK